MTTTKFIREQLGLSQETMTMYLSIRLSQLAMHETGKRDLPTGVMVELAAIMLFLNKEQQFSKQAAEIEKKQAPQMQDFIEKQIKELKLKEIKTQRKLDAIQKKYEQSLKLNSFATHLKNNKSKLAALMQIQAFSEIEKNSLVAQTKQILKLEGIKSQLAYLKKKTECINIIF